MILCKFGARGHQSSEAGTGVGRSHMCFHVNIAKFFRKLILRNICERLLFEVMDTNFENNFY